MVDSTTRGEPGARADSAGWLTAVQLDWLWRLAIRLHACGSAAEAEAVAARAHRDLAELGGGPAVATALAETLRPALAALRERDRLRTLATQDPLTGLGNRRFLEEELARLIGGSSPGRRLAFALLDLDRFRDVNERHGHRAGDVVLQLVGLLVQGFRGPNDVACRYGGEEFVMVMPDATAAEAQERLEPLLATLAGMSTHHEGRHLEPITASIGVAEFPAHGSTIAALVDAADAALFRAKNRGRDRICVAAEGLLPSRPQAHE